jgi:DNA polymerase-3 subunit epsilon
MLTKTELKAMRLRLAPGQMPKGREWRGYQWADLYDPAECATMRPRREPTAAQVAALERGRALKARDLYVCRCCGQDVDEWRMATSTVCIQCKRKPPEHWHTPAARVYLDTETTGLGDLPDTDFIEVALVDGCGQPVINTLCNPGFAIPADATAIHGITDDMLRHAPPTDVVRAQVIEAVRGKSLVIYNADYDLKFFPGIVEAAASVHCCMLRYSDYVGEWSDYRRCFRWHKLAEAASASSFKWQGEAHRALADSLAARHVWHWLDELTVKH